MRLLFLTPSGLCESNSVQRMFTMSSLANPWTQRIRSTATSPRCSWTSILVSSNRMMQSLSYVSDALTSTGDCIGIRNVLGTERIDYPIGFSSASCLRLPPTKRERLNIPAASAHVLIFVVIPAAGRMHSISISSSRACCSRHVFRF